MVTLLLEGPKVVKAETVLFGELAQMGPSEAEHTGIILFDVSMTIGVVKGL